MTVIFIGNIINRLNTQRLNEIDQFVKTANVTVTTLPSPFNVEYHKNLYDALKSPYFIFYFGPHCNYESICETMFFMGLGKKMAIIWDEIHNVTINSNQVNQNMKMLCINEFELKSFVFKEAEQLKIPVFHSYSEFAARYTQFGSFDLNKFIHDVSNRIGDQEYQEKQYSSRSDRIKSNIGILQQSGQLSEKKQTKLAKLTNQSSKRNEIHKTYIAPHKHGRKNDQLEMIFRRFMHVNRSIDQELRVIKPHRINPTLFLNIPYRIVRKADVKDNPRVTANVGDYKSINMNMAMMMSYHWGLLLYYLSNLAEDRVKVIELLKTSSIQNSSLLSSSLSSYGDEQIIAAEGGVKDNIQKVIKIYQQYRSFTENKLHMLDIQSIMNVIDNSSVINNRPYHQYGREYSKTEALQDFVKTITEIIKEHGIDVSIGNRTELVKNYIGYLCTSINNSRQFLHDIIKVYPYSFKLEQYDTYKFDEVKFAQFKAQLN